MDMKIISDFSSFRNSIIYKNRFFFSDDPLLKKLKKQIEDDLNREEPIMVSTISKGSVLYRARIMDKYLESSKYYITDLMKQHGLELAQISRCKLCQEDDLDNCTQKASEESAEYFRRKAKEQLQKEAISRENGFNGFGCADSSLPPVSRCDDVSDMRANPKYIRYLYAASDIYTALLEARSNINALVSVANIEILESLRIWDITNSLRYRMEDSEKDNELFFLLQEINNSFSTPVSGELKDYLVSQVISEFIKCLDFAPHFDGICFSSSLNPVGKNYTIFSEEKFCPISSEAYYIKEIGLTAYAVTDGSGAKIDCNNPGISS